MSKKVDYSLKFYKGKMITENEEEFKFYLSGRSSENAYNAIKDYVYSHKDRYHIIPSRNDIKRISITEVPIEDYGTSYGYEIIN